MKYLSIGALLALGLSMQPALADSKDAAQAKDPANNAESVHAPTNRVGEMVPTMTSPENTDDATAGGDSDGNSAETLHAPTNRIGDEVPDMKGPDAGKAQ
jgi:hypothetical protein